MEIVIDIQKVGKVYASERGPVHALENFSMQVQKGDFAAIVGPSGCGKTTLLWGLTGLHPFTAGVAYILGKKVELPRREVGIVFQQANLLPWRNMIQNITFPLEIMKEDLKAYEERVRDLIASVELSGFESHYPRELSGGMQQRASIVRALSFDPDVLLMDEPFGALDAQTRLLMQELLIRVWESHRLTVLFVTHDVDEAVFISDRVVVMTNRPGTVKEEVTVDLPRPRAFELQATQEFLALRSRVLASIREETLRSDVSISPGGGVSR